MIPQPKYYRNGKPINLKRFATVMRKGWIDQKSGFGREHCPYKKPLARPYARAWLDGWDAANENDETIFGNQPEPKELLTRIEWEPIEHSHGCYLSRASVPGGWLVLCTENVFHGELLPHALKGDELYNRDWRSSITFVPDPDHRWASSESTVPTAKLTTHQYAEFFGQMLGAAMNLGYEGAANGKELLSWIETRLIEPHEQLERFRSLIKEADIDDPDERMTRYGIFDEDGRYQPPDCLPNIPALEKQIASLKDELENQRKACEPCPNCNGKGVLLYGASFKEYQCTNCCVRFPDCRTLYSQLREAEKWKEPRLKRVQPCGCVVCICEDPVQCHGCGAKDCGQPDCVFFCGVPTSSAEWEPHPLVEERDRLLVEIKNESANRETWHREATGLRDAISKLKAQIRDLKELQSASPSALDRIRHLEIKLQNSQELVKKQARMLQEAHAQLTCRDKAFQTLIASIRLMKTDTVGEFWDALDWAYQEALNIHRSIVDASTTSTPSTEGDRP